MFQIAALYVYSKKYAKIITISQKKNDFIDNSKLFENHVISDYYELNDADNDHKLIPFGNDIMLVGKFKSFKKYNEATLDFMREFIYSNEDYMYSAYHKYNEIKVKFGTEDDNQLTSVYIDEHTNLSYYKKALILINKKNIVLFSSKEMPLELNQMLDDYSYNVQVVWDTNIYSRFILMSLFRHNICQYDDPYYSIWSAYISKYDDLKTVVVPDHAKTFINENVNNINFVYLD